MVSNRLDILANTLKSGDPDKHVFEIANSMTAEEWAEVILNQKGHKDLLPYIIHTFSKEKIDALECIIGNNLGQYLAEAWFLVLNGSSKDLDEQPSIETLGLAPCLVPVLNGGLLKKLENTGYSVEFENFIQQRHSQIISELVVFASNATEKQLQRTVYGTLDKSGIFPPLTDYNTQELEDLMGYAYLVNSIEYISSLLGLDEVKSVISVEELESALNDRKFESLMDLASFSETKKRRNTRELKTVEGFIVGATPKYIDRFSSLTLGENEKMYLASLFHNKMIDLPQEEVVEVEVEGESVSESNVVTPASQDDIPSIDIGEPSADYEVQPQSEAGHDAKEVDVTIPPKKGLFEKLTDGLATFNKSSADEDEDDSIEEMLVKNGSRKKNVFLNPVVILLLVLGFLGWFFAVNGGNNDTNSIIEQKAQAEQEQAFLPAVKVHTK
ncbi:hypothetical protein [Vibrio sp. D431a]|uniref:hypothetical protein n=1 Tax=Vibrio sp. D431a TaxID=2837388 RepID=UPI00255363EF|nr:hypothetical protein [Vibrio sp. D431a]MDK9793230.1 hypothetical protein [Vibrio sp. D431a]